MNQLQTIAIIGGGISGSLTAFHLRRLGVPARIVVVDPAPEIGLGLAYSTRSMEHLLNVPAGKMSLLPDQPDHFLDWLQANYDPAMTAERFAPRAIFGRYMQSLLKGASAIEHVRAKIFDYRSMDGKAMLTMSGGQTLMADIVVLATGNFLPAMLPGISEAVNSSGAYCHSAWDERTYTGLSPDAPGGPYRDRSDGRGCFVASARTGPSGTSNDDLAPRCLASSPCPLFAAGQMCNRRETPKVRSRVAPLCASGNQSWPALAGRYGQPAGTHE